jgi:hypothetical protein
LSRWGGLSASKQSCHSDARNETNEVICTLFSETMNQIECQRRSTMDIAGKIVLLEGEDDAKEAFGFTHTIAPASR